MSIYFWVKLLICIYYSLLFISTRTNVLKGVFFLLTLSLRLVSAGSRRTTDPCVTLEKAIERIN